MYTVFYYFLTTSLDEIKRENPYVTDQYLGEVNDFVEIDGIGYYITDYAIETWSEYEGENIFW